MPQRIEAFKLVVAFRSGRLLFREERRYERWRVS
jgi:hypothetical protein